MKKILVIDDEPSIRKLLRVSLEANDYQIFEAQNGQEGLQRTIESKPDIILLDLGLPDKSGLVVIKEIREWSQTPIIVLTVLEDDATKIEALDGGADDYITKPFSIPELMVRMRVALRHALPAHAEGNVLKSGALELDLSSHLVSVDKQNIKLTSTEFDILKTLLKYKGKVVTHKTLLKEVWGPNSVEHVQYLRVYLGNLRKKLKTETSNQDFILTEAGVGYRLQDLDKNS